MRSLTAKRSTRGERRQLTVLSCDLVNSVELSTRFDPEDLAKIVSGFQSSCEKIIGRFDGYVARFTGDGLKVYFGYPRADEYAPGRAVRAALALLSAVRELKLGPELVLSTRIGIATGDVAVGELIGTGEAQERTVAGETPNLAARLQELGQPDSITIADSTKRLVGRLFEYTDLGKNVLKGFPAPIQAWRVLGEGSTTSHFEAVRTETSLSQFVGREEELAFLRHRWLQVKAGKGQIVLLCGEAGVGKSRLTMALRRSLMREAPEDLRHYCSPYHQNSSFYPIIRQLEHGARISSTDTPQARLQKLENLLSKSKSDVSDIAPWLALLLSIPTKTPDPPLGVSPAQQKRRILNALDARLTGLAAHAPLLLVFEDVHWVDPSTREFLDRLIKRVTKLPVLLVMTIRPDLDPAWERCPGVTTRVLPRLSRQESERIVRALDKGCALPPKALDQILDYSDGLPLFVEELTKAALEAEREQVSARGLSKITSVSAFRVPHTLQDSLLARLDRLGPWKRVAQTAAVIGRSFTFKVLVALFPHDQTSLGEALQGLVRAGLIVERGTGPDATYTFAHALLQEAASACLLHADRREIHQRIAEALEGNFPEIAVAEPELLALHYTGAGKIDAAISYWQKAAERALQRSANVEAAHHFGQSLSLLGTLPQSSSRDERELTLQTRLGATLTTVKGFAAPEVAAAYERARMLCNVSQDVRHRFPVLRGLWGYYFVSAKWQAADDSAEEMLTLAQDQKNSGYALEGHRALGMAALWRGHFDRALTHLQEGLRLYRPEQHHAHALSYGNDPGIACLVHEAFALWVLGCPDQALDKCGEAIKLARDLTHPFSLAQALIYSIFIHERRGEAQTVREMADEAKSLAIEHGFPFWLAEASIMKGWALAAQGETEDGVLQLRNGVTDFLTTGARMDKPRWLSLLAEAYGNNNQIQEALEASSEALDLVAETKECFFQARLYQVRGELLLKEGSADAAVNAEACFREALAVAGQQHAKSWELCAATSLARLWCAQLKRREAHDLLAPIYNSFTEGFDTADLKDAKALLDELARGS